MTTKLPASFLNDFSQFIMREMGLYFPQSKWKDLERGILAAAKALEVKEIEAEFRHMMSASLSQKQTEILASYLTIGESYFFRDQDLFNTLEKNILPSLIYKRYTNHHKYLRIWSAGCSTGEEPYSIAILLYKLIPDIKNWNINLLASDINTKSLIKLSNGIYSEWSFRNVDPKIKKDFFIKRSDRTYEILPQIKKLVESSYFNLSKDKYPSLLNKTNAMDIIFCRNVLMYFPPDVFQSMLNKFFDCLVDGGYLFVGQSEHMPDWFSHYKKECINGTIFYQKIQKVASPHIKKTSHESPAPIKEKPIETTSPSSKIINYKAKALEYANKGDLQDSLDWSEKALLENKTDTDLHYLRAAILEELGEHQAAIHSLNHVIFLDQQFVLAYMMLANIYHNMGNKLAAEKNLNYALSLLNDLNAKVILPSIGDMTVKRLREMIRAMSELEH